MAEADPGPAVEGPRILLVGYDGVDDLDFFGAWSVLSKASQASRTEPPGGRLTARILAPAGAFVTAGGLRISGEAAPWPAVAEAVVVPGGAGAGAAALREDLRDRLIALRKAGARFYTICSGSLILAGCGLLKGKRVAIHAAKTDLLREAGCAQIVAGLNRDGWLTSIGGQASAAVKSVAIGLRVVEDLCPSHAGAVRDRMELAA